MKVNFDLRNILEEASMKAVSVSKGDLVLSENTPLDKVIFITKGKLRLYSHSESGKQLSLHYLKENDVCLISASCAMGNKKFPVAVKAAENTEFVMLKTEEFYRLISQNQELLKLVLSSLGERVVDLLEDIKDRSFLNLRQRLIKFLLKNNTNSTFLGTHDQLAHELGTSREVVSRSIKSLVSAGCVSSERERVTILKPEEMRILCD